MTPKEKLVDELAGDAAELSAIGADIRRKFAICRPRMSVNWPV